MILTLTNKQATAVHTALKANDADAQMFPDYSGKFMYGARCLAFTALSAIEVSIAFMNAALDGGWFEEAKHILTLAREDDFGLATVIYFPGIQIAD